MGIYDPQRWAYKTLIYRDREFLDGLEAKFGNQGHGRKFHVWRWEKQLSDFFGSTWKDRTIDNEEWASHFHSWLQWRKSEYNAKRRHGERSCKRFRISLESALEAVVKAPCDNSSSSDCTDSSSSSPS